MTNAPERAGTAGTACVWAVVVAAGSGTRFGRPKQFEALAGRRVLDRSIEAARSVAGGVVAVVPAGTAPADMPHADAVVVGGATRSASVRAALGALPAGVDFVVVHDAARPLATPSLFARVLAPLAGGAAASIPVLEVSETVKRVEGGAVVGTLERYGLVTVQTPQAFRAGVLFAAHSGETEATDDAALVEALGLEVAVVPGDPRNLKITVPSDLVVAEALLGAG